MMKIYANFVVWQSKPIHSLLNIVVYWWAFINLMLNSVYNSVSLVLDPVKIINGLLMAYLRVDTEIIQCEGLG